MHRVLQQVEQDLQELVGIGRDLDGLGREVLDHLDRADPELVGEEVERLVHELAEPHGTLLGRLLAGERQQVLHDLRGALGLRVDLAQPPLDALREVGRGREEVGEAGDDRERVVQLVGDARDEAAERRELLALAHPLLGPPPLPDVVEVDREAVRRGVGAHLEPRVAGRIELLEPHRHLLGHRPPVLPEERRADRVGIRVPDAAPEQLLPPAPQELLRLAVHVGEPLLAVEREEAVADGLEDVADRLLRLAPLGDVARVHDDPRHHGVVEHVLADALEHPPGAVAVAEAELERRDGARHVPLGADRPGHRGDVVRVDQVARVPAEQLARLVAEHPLDRGALVADPVLAVDHRHDVERVLGERAEVLLAPAERLDRARVLGPHAQGLEPVRDVGRELRDQPHLLGIEGAGLDRVDGHDAALLPAQRERHGQHRGEAAGQRLVAPRGERGVAEQVPADARLPGPGRDARGAAPALGVGPRDLERCQVALLEPRAGDGPHGPAGIVLRDAGPGEAIAADVDDDAADLPQERLRVGRAQERVVAGAERPERAVGPAQAFRGLQARGDVPGDNGDAGEPAGVHDRRHAQRHVHGAAVLAPPHRLVTRDVLAPAKPSPDVTDLVDALGRGRHLDGPADRLGGAVAVEPLGARVPALDHALGRRPDDRVLGRLHDRRQPAPRLGRALRGGHVLEVPLVHEDPTVPVADGADLHPHVEHRAVPAAPACLEVVHDAVALDRLQEAAPVREVHVERGRPDRPEGLEVRVAQHLEHRGVRVQDPALGRRPEQRGRHGLEERAVARLALAKRRLRPAERRRAPGPWRRGFLSARPRLAHHPSLLTLGCAVPG